MAHNNRTPKSVLDAPVSTPTVIRSTDGLTRAQRRGKKLSPFAKAMNAGLHNVPFRGSVSASLDAEVEK